MDKEGNGRNTQPQSVTIQNNALTSYQRSNMMMDPDAHQRVRGRALQVMSRQIDNNDSVDRQKRIHEEGRNFNNTQYKGK